MNKNQKIKKIKQNNYFFFIMLLLIGMLMFIIAFLFLSDSDFIFGIVWVIIGILFICFSIYILVISRAQEIAGYSIKNNRIIDNFTKKGVDISKIKYIILQERKRIDGGEWIWDIIRQNPVSIEKIKNGKQNASLKIVCHDNSVWVIDTFHIFEIEDFIDKIKDKIRTYDPNSTEYTWVLTGEQHKRRIKLT